MPKYVDLSPYWTDDKDMSIQKANQKTGLDKRTLSAAKKGHLDRGHFETLFKLKELASELAGKPLNLEEIFTDKDN
jgi:DNA-binding Xre family transcriptional regulator